MEVNPSTGKVRVKRLIVAQDIGLIINPGTLKNVTEGAAMQGISRSLIEEVTFNKQNVTSTDWVSYPVLEIGDAPRTTMEIILIDNPKEKSSGAGENGCMRTVGPAIANAVFEATAVCVRCAPLTPAYVAGMVAIKTEDQKA